MSIYVMIVVFAAKSHSGESDVAMLGTVVAFVLSIAFTILFGKRFDPDKWSGRMSCERCGHQWKARGSMPPARCPSCRSKVIVTLNR